MRINFVFFRGKTDPPYAKKSFSVTFDTHTILDTHKRRLIVIINVIKKVTGHLNAFTILAFFTNLLYLLNPLVLFFSFQTPKKLHRDSKRYILKLARNV